MFPFTPQDLPYRLQYVAPPQRQFSYPYGSLPVTPSNVFGFERRVVSIHHPSMGFMTPDPNMNYQQTNGGELAANFQPSFQGMNVERLPIYSQNRRLQFVQPTPLWYPPQPLENAAGNLSGASESTLDPNAKEFIPSGLLRQRVSFKNAGMNLVNMASEEDLVVIEKAIEQAKKESLQLGCKPKKHGNKSYSYGEWATGRLKGQGSDYELVEFDDNFVLVKVKGKNVFRTSSEYCDSDLYKEAVSPSFQWRLADREIKFDFTQALNEEKLRLLFCDLYGSGFFVPSENVLSGLNIYFMRAVLLASFYSSEFNPKDEDSVERLAERTFREGSISPCDHLFSEGLYFSPNGFVFKLFQLRVNTLRLPVGISEAAAAPKSLQKNLPFDDSVKGVVISKASDLIDLVRDSFISFRTTIESNVIAGVNISRLVVEKENQEEHIVSILFIQGHLFLRFCAFCYSESIRKAEVHYIKSLLGFSNTINICIAQRNQSINEASIFFLGLAWLSVVYETEEKKLFHKAVISELESKQKTEAFSSCLAKTACNILSRAISSENYCDVAKLTLFVMSKSTLLETVNEAIATSWLEACASICNLLRKALGASDMFSDVSGDKVLLWIKFEEMECNIWKYFVRPIEAICKKIESNHKELVASHNLSNVDATMREMFCEFKTYHGCFKSIDELANFISHDAQGKRAHKETFFHSLVHAKKKAIDKEYPAISSGSEKAAAGAFEKAFAEQAKKEERLEKLLMDKKEALSVRLCAAEKTRSSIQRIVNGEFAQPEFGELLFWVYGEMGHYLHVNPAVFAFYEYKVLVNKLNNHCLELTKKLDQEEAVHKPLEWFEANSWTGKPLKVTELHKLCWNVHNKPIITEAKVCLQSAVLCFEHGLDLAIIQVEGVAGKRSDEKQHSAEMSHLEFYLEELKKIKVKYELFTTGASLNQLLENRKQLFKKMGLYCNKTNAATNKKKGIAMNDLRQAADKERQLSSQDLNVEMIHSLVDKKTKQLETLYSLMG